MARPRIPTNVHELKGSFKHNPDRGRAREAEPEPKAGIGPAPDYLSPQEKDAWDYLVGIAPNAVLGDCDRGHMELTAKLFAYSRSVTMAEMDAAKLNKLLACLGQLGMNPADRSKVKVIGGGKSKNKFDDI